MSQPTHTYRVALIGCGPRGMQQGLAYAAHPRTELVGVCDLDPARREALGDRLGVAVREADAETLLRTVAPDLAVLPTGTEFHHELCLLALERGCHVDVEKPFCTELAQADQVMRRARAMDLRVAVHHQTRVGAWFRAVQAALAAGDIGPPLSLAAQGKGYYGGFGLLNIGTHLVTNLVGLAGHCRGVTALGLAGDRPIGPEDVLTAPLGMGTIAGEHLDALLEFDHGVVGTLRQHRLRTMDSGAMGIEVAGETGRLRLANRGAWLLDRPHCAPDAAWRPLEPVHHPAWDPDGEVADDELWYVEEYVRALDEDRAHPCSGVEGLHTLEVLMGVFGAAATQRRVELPQADRSHPLLRWRREHGLPDPGPAPRDYGEWLKAVLAFCGD